MDTPGNQPAEVAQPSLAEAAKARQAQSDLELLVAIGRRQDRQAFEEIHARYQQQAYNLALHLTGNPATAEEALQEALLRIWRYAATFREEGSAKGWLLKVFAQASLYTARREGRGRTRERHPHSQPEACDPGSPLPESSEAMTALRAALARLPERDRRLVTLLYGAGMSQEEIAAELRMSQRSISYRNRLVLDQLRANLTRLGFAAALPLLERHLEAALLETPLSTPAQGALNTARLEAAIQASTPGAASSGARRALWTAAALALAAAAGTGWWASSYSGSGPHPPALPAAEPAPGTATRSGGSGQAQRPAFWRFDGPAETRGLSLIAESRWHWEPGGGPDGSGCMETDTQWFSIVLDTPAEPLPLQVTFQVQNRVPKWDPNGWGRWLLWTHAQKAADFLYIAPQIWVVGRPSFPWLATRFLVTERFLVMHSGVIRHLLATERHAGARLQLGLQGKHRIDDLRVAPVDPKEIPDVSAYLAALERIPIEKRVGLVTVPELPCPISGKQITIHFFSQQTRPILPPRPRE